MSEGSVKVKYSNCSIRCEGMEFQCPLCRTIVRSGEQHICKKPTFDSEIEVKAKPKLTKKRGGTE